MEKYTAESLFKMVTEMVAEVTIGKRAEDGDAKTFQVFPKDMVLPAIERALRYGIQRAVNDPIGGKDKTLKDKCEAAEDIILSWYSGEFKPRKNAAPKLSDEETFKRKWLLDTLKASFIEQHSKETWKAKTEAESGAAFIAAILEKNMPLYADELNAAWKTELETRVAKTAIKSKAVFDI